MPFYAIDWSRYANHVDVRTPPDAESAVQETLHWTFRLCKIFGFYLSYHLPKKHRWICYVHAGVLATLCLVFLFIAAATLRFVRWSAEPQSLQVISLFSYLLQCVACAGALIFWQLRKIFVRFCRSLQTCTMGVGLMKESKRLLTVSYVVLGTCAFWPLILVAYFILHVYFGDLPIPKAWNDSSVLWHESTNPATLIGLVYMSVCWWLGHTLMVMFYVFALTELHVLNLDLQSDENLYQVPVLKHYIAIHFRLVNLYDQVNAAFKPVLTASVVENVLLLIWHVYALIVNQQWDLADLLFTIVVLIYVATYCTVVIVCAILYERLTRFIFDATLLVAVSDRNLYSEYYPIANNYFHAFSVKEKRNSIISQLCKISILSLAFFVIIYQLKRQSVTFY